MPGDPTLLMSYDPDPRYGVWWLYGGREVVVPVTGLLWLVTRDAAAVCRVVTMWEY